MTESFITRCPKCSTAFRVNNDVLSMAKGKVRCGQCFHIFDAKQHIDAAKKNTHQTPQENRLSETEASSSPKPAPKNPPESPKSSTMLFTSADEEPVNPEWLQTLFTEDDLAPGSSEDFRFSHQSPQPTTDTHRSADTKSTNATKKPAQVKQDNPDIQATVSEQKQASPKLSEHAEKDLAPWERELAEVEQAIRTKPSSTSTLPPKKEGTLKNLQQSDLIDKIDSRINSQPNQPEPDYMQALHSLAQNVAESSPAGETTPSYTLNTIGAYGTTDPLMGDYYTEQVDKKKTAKTWIWTLGCFLGLMLLIAQMTSTFFEQGSRSETFRGFYRTLCAYSGCTLPSFENIKAISIEHVRIQSHPNQPDALLVNAIMTNNSRYAQPMPKLALEFFDLNGAPVAARLFAPHNYLDKDFLDITYMPPKTPIHIVIPIQDPGDRAVTHQLRIFPADTRSY
ncbi:hypothetical protein MSP8887_01913 [Marinomonas spartinae]|uniref:Zinc finger/thioredoxin putative domain-containing protein n=1 Tax=Marinomonas spartinae TaxID=1792290 RepID=A0A1A8TCT4_9GAMM|nr:DUF3426 domain-containing protein [Marinomonas spartinae]SBS30898.1 hypothetical protein MSP8886_01963 [Marinomonas spartinae]SBS33289.1 hypothetical protein MSP8887_01913 [Marinomonas spartinae]